MSLNSFFNEIWSLVQVSSEDVASLYLVRLFGFGFVDIKTDVKTADSEFVMSIATEYCEGGTVLDALDAMATAGARWFVRLSKPSFFPDNDRVLSWSCDLFAGLQWLHQLDIIHNDISPRNVFIGKTADGKEVRTRRKSQQAT